MRKYVLTIFYEILQRVSRDNCARYFRNHYPDEYRRMMQATSFLDKFEVEGAKNKRISIFERIYCMEHDMFDRPKC